MVFRMRLKLPEESPVTLNVGTVKKLSYLMTAMVSSPYEWMILSKDKNNRQSINQSIGKQLSNLPFKVWRHVIFTKNKNINNI